VSRDRRSGQVADQLDDVVGKKRSAPRSAWAAAPARSSGRCRGQRRARKRSSRGRGWSASERSELLRDDTMREWGRHDSPGADPDHAVAAARWAMSTAGAELATAASPDGCSAPRSLVTRVARRRARVGMVSARARAGVDPAATVARSRTDRGNHDWHNRRRTAVRFPVLPHRTSGSRCHVGRHAVSRETDAASLKPMPRGPSPS